MDEGKAPLAAQPLQEAMSILGRMQLSNDYDFASVLVAHGLMLARTGKAEQGETQLQQGQSRSTPRFCLTRTASWRRRAARSVRHCSSRAS
ncbi:MAG: hypothetical protein HC872_08345 [Gammaproteobacteria bacterium]|nr:hypothetical protein [Gammaproteobacteria bacterium]